MSKKFMSMFLALVMCLTLTVSATSDDEAQESTVPAEPEVTMEDISAVGTEEELAPHAGGTCNGNHVWRRVEQRAGGFVSVGSSGHAQMLYTTFQCVNCEVQRVEESTGSVFGHTLQKIGATDEGHIEKTTSHRAIYTYGCVVCSYTKDEPVILACPGEQTGSCIIIR